MPFYIHSLCRGPTIVDAGKMVFKLLCTELLDIISRECTIAIVVIYSYIKLTLFYGATQIIFESVWVLYLQYKFHV